MNPSEAGAGPTLRCAAHPGTETYLRCAQCQIPICPRCLVMTPVGAKCRACARARPLPTFELSPLEAAAVTVATLLSTLVLGTMGSILLRFVPLFLMVFPFAAGFALGEVVSLVANRKRHVWLRVVAGAGVVLSYFVLVLGDFIVHGPLELVGSGMLLPLLGNALIGVVENPFAVIFIALGVWVAISRAG